MKKFFITFFTVITIFSSIIYFFSCFTSYISSVVFWPMSFLALGFPYIAAFIIFLLFIWLFIKPLTAFTLLLLLLIGYKNLHATIALNSAASPHTKGPVSLKVLSWNVRGFDNASERADTPNSVRRQMFEYIKRSGADVVCLQEFFEHSAPGFLSNTKALMEIGYRYVYRTDELHHYFDYGTYKSGSAIFSKIPIKASGKTLLGDSSYPENLAFIDIVLQNKPVRIFTTHFKSLNLFAGPNDTTSVVLFHNDRHFVYNTSKLDKLKIFDQEHVKQAIIAKAELNKSPYPVVFTGDLNSVPASYTYAKMSQGLQDAFILKGSGLGKTLDNLPLTLRIDFLLAGKKFVISQFKKDTLHLSDHYPQIMDVLWKQ